MKQKNLHPIAAELLAEIEAYRARTGINKTNFGLKAVNNGHLIERLEFGQIPKIVTIERVRDYINRNTKAVRK